MNSTVDEYVQTRILPEHQAIVKRLRELMRECAPDADEQISYDMPVWKNKWVFVYLTHSKTHITFAFVRGVQFEDRYGLLTGNGKSARHVKIKKTEDINEEALRYYIQQAVAFDAQ